MYNLSYMHVTLLLLQYLVVVLWRDDLLLRQLYPFNSSYNSCYMHIKLKYLQVISSQSETLEPKEVPLYNHFQMRNDTLLLFCDGISGCS